MSDWADVKAKELLNNLSVAGDDCATDDMWRKDEKRIASFLRAARPHIPYDLVADYEAAKKNYKRDCVTAMKIVDAIVAIGNWALEALKP